MDWMTGFTGRPGLVEEYVAATGAVLGGRNGWDLAAASGSRPLSCDVAEAVRIGLEAAGGKNLEVHSPTIGRQLLERGLLDEIDLHLAPVLLGDGIRLYDNPGGRPVRLAQPDAGDPVALVDVRYRPAQTGAKTESSR
jgi:hypothetical protein